MPDEFPADLKDFITRHIESVAQMEALLWVRQDPDHQWSAEELSKGLYLTSDMCETMLADLQRRGFLVREGDAPAIYRYQPADPMMDKIIGRLADVYQERRVAVITQIHSRPIDKVQTFADAFRLRRDE
jgi:hypothetical protein